MSHEWEGVTTAVETGGIRSTGLLFVGSVWLPNPYELLTIWPRVGTSGGPL
jgi:hypothetical protein